MSMYLDLNEANKKLTKLGFLVVRFKRGSMKKPMVCRKTSKNDFKEIQVSDTFIEKVKANTLIVDDNIDVLPTLNLQVLSDFDKRQEVIESHRALQKQLKKESTKFLNVKNAIIARGAGNKYFVIDINSNEAKIVDSSLINTEEVHYTKEQVTNALRDNLINLYQKAFDREIAKWDAIKIAK